MQRLMDVWDGVRESVLFKMSLTIGAGVSTPTFKPPEDILNIHYDTN